MAATMLTPGRHQTPVGHPRQKLRPWRASLMLAALLALSSALLAGGGAARQAGADGDGFVSLALPPGGEVVVENRRGGVHVEVWDEAEVELSASVERRPGAPTPRPAPKRASKRKAAPEAGLPVGVERSGNTLRINVVR